VFGEPVACPIHHRLGNVGGRDVATRADNHESALGREARTGRGVEHPLAQPKTSRPQEERQKMRRDMGDGSVVRACGLVLE
jgi:hypothetical protein